MPWIAIALVLSICMANVAVCIAVARDRYYSRGQVVSQAAIIWLLPVAGAVLVAIALFQQKVGPGPAQRPPAGASGSPGEAVEALQFTDAAEGE